ncbi:MAG: integrin alpha [Mangrovicoccus sp.]|nr:integrin alpha [Mangrovicoccus sp.]
MPNLLYLTGLNGFQINGKNANDFSGFSVSDAGDVNGDGFSDLIIGAPYADANGQTDSGESYVIFGQADGFAAQMELTALDGSTGFRLKGVSAGDFSGSSVASAGDLNGDGYDDVIIGAYRADGAAGASYVVFGKASGFASDIDLSTLSGSDGFRIDGVDPYDFSGIPVASAGDLNGDGFDDLIIGASGADPQGKDRAGETYVIFGKSDGYAPQLSLADLNSDSGFVITGEAKGDESGISVSTAGDVNGDGIDDIIIGAEYADNGDKALAGASYVIFGTTDGFPDQLDLSALNGSNGFRLAGAAPGDTSGAAVSSAGDINGDGIDDLIIGAPSADPNGVKSAGETYIVFGRSSSFGSAVDLAALDGTNGFRVQGTALGDEIGGAVANAGDMNGDGYDDLILSTAEASPHGETQAGVTYVLFGKADGFAETVDLASLDGDEGVKLTGIDAFDKSGHSVSAAGDVNGDGYDDVIIGGHLADPNGVAHAGKAMWSLVARTGCLQLKTPFSLICRKTCAWPKAALSASPSRRPVRRTAAATP